MQQFQEWIYSLFSRETTTHEAYTWWVQLSLLLLLIGVAVATYWVCRYILVNSVHKLLLKSRIIYLSQLANTKVLCSICHLVPPTIIYNCLPIVIPQHVWLLTLLLKATVIYFLIFAIRSINISLSALFKLTSNYKQLRNRPLKGVYQIVQVILIFVGVILAISILFDKSPLTLLAGLGASAAVLMLVFKDTIIGLVSGIQLAANDMLRPGDWIEVPKHGVDGAVQDVTLTTVKIRNWDNTTVTIPPYLLVSESFQNWRGMSESAGRRIKRAIQIDVSTIKFCTPALLEQLSQLPLLAPYIAEHREEELTNLGLFRRYIELYLETTPYLNRELSHVVRQLKPTAEGVPLEIYFFSREKMWIAYENIQSDLFDHLFAIISTFELAPFQSLSNHSLQHIAINRETK